MDSYELMQKLKEYAATLGWDLVDWDFMDVHEDIHEYTIWIREMNK